MSRALAGAELWTFAMPVGEYHVMQLMTVRTDGGC